MLKKVKYNEKVDALLKSELITNLNILGALSYEAPAHLYVDDEVNPTGIYVDIDGLQYLYAQEETFADKIFETFKEKKVYCFSGIKRNLAEYIKGKYEPTWENPCDIYYYPHSSVDLSDIQSKVVSIPIEEAKRIDSYYTFKSDESLGEIEANLRLRPSAGVYEDGKLVSWVLVHEDDSMGIMYTVEGYRRKDYAMDVSLVLIDKMLKQEKTPYVQIVESNQMSPGLAKKCGFIKSGKCTWMGIEVK